MKSKHIGMGVVIMENVIDVDQDLLFEYMTWVRKNQEDTFTYHEEDGIKYATNKTGFKFNLSDIEKAPQRFLDTKGKQLDIEVPQKYIDFIDSLENAIYDALVEYCCYFPDAATTSWWRPNGHIAGYLNDCVETEEELNGHNYTGGKLHFPNISTVWKPKSGSVAIYPSSYIGRHEVLPVEKGERYAYLSIACYGTSFEQEEVVGQENGYKVWMPNLIEDYQKKMSLKDYSL